MTHVPWCMSGSITRGGGENVPGIPGACAPRNFTYPARGPCDILWYWTQLLESSWWYRSKGFMVPAIVVILCLVSAITAAVLARRWHANQPQQSGFICTTYLETTTNYWHKNRMNHFTKNKACDIHNQLLCVSSYCAVTNTHPHQLMELMCDNVSPEQLLPQ